MRNNPRRVIATTAVSLLLLVLTLGMTSCMVREELSIDGSGSGSLSLTINLNSILLSYYSDLLSAMTGVEGDYPVFDLDQLVAAFDERPALTLTRIERSALGQIRLEISFDDLNAVFADGEIATSGTVAPSEVFAFESRGSRRELTVHLDRAAINSFLAFAPPESAMMTEFLFPPDDGSVSREQYQEELSWALEEYEDPSVVERVLTESAFEVVVRPVGRIVSQSGGVFADGTVTFRVPVLELLTLAEEQIYSVVFEP